MIKDKNIKEWFFNQTDHSNNEIIKILDVEYAYLKLENKDDLYVTKYGLPFIENLRPENFWSDKEWFQANSEKLSGTSILYKVRTKKINGRQKDIVIKWNRMGQLIPGAEDCEELAYAEFNSPFEEFSLVMELRQLNNNLTSDKIYIQRPLAIYTPNEKVDFGKTGRKEYIIKSKIKSHKDIQLDMSRLYAVIYEWIKGIDVVQAYERELIDEKYLEFLTRQTEEKMGMNGFTVKDRKPNHIIVRPGRNKQIKRNRDGKILYGLIDFELLQRTPEKEKELKQIRRHDYLVRQRDRFTTEYKNKFHPHLKHVNILDVDYIYGHVESTKGALWVVGDDPYLFDYFLPERWEKTSKTKLSRSSQVYYTITKDDINLVWKVSKVGIQPNMDPFNEKEKRIIEYGYNSPFEEFSIAMELNQKGIPTIYPRAIYMTGNKTIIRKIFFDNTRYETHNHFLTPDGNYILKKNRDYIIIWGFWNGPDEKLADRDGDYYHGINALHAYKTGIISEKKYIYFLQMIKQKLSDTGIEDLNLTGSHFLISIDSKGNLIKDEHGIPEIRICNFQFLRRL
jgi:hypothetical protein